MTKLVAAEAEQLLEASKADRKAAALEDAKKAALAEAERWRHAKLERFDVTFVHALCFVVARVAHALLLFEPAALVDWVIELAKAFAELGARDDDLKPLDNVRPRRVALCQGLEEHWHAGEERRARYPLADLLPQQVDRARLVCVSVAKCDTCLFCRSNRLLFCTTYRVDTKRVLYLGRVVELLPLGCKINLVSADSKLRRAVHLLHNRAI